MISQSGSSNLMSESPETTSMAPRMTRRIIRGAALTLVLGAPASALAQARFTIVEENQTWASVTGSSSEYVAAQATPGASKPVVMTGNFDLGVVFPGGSLTALSATAGVGSIFAGVLDFNGSQWEVEGSPRQVDKLEPMSTLPALTPVATVRDLAVVDRNRYFLTGIIDDATFFRNKAGTDFFLTADPTAPAQRGFVAAGSNGSFTAAHHLDLTMQPRALATDRPGSFIVFAGQQRDGTATNFEGDDAEVHHYALPLPAGGLPSPTTISDSKLQGVSLDDVAVATGGQTWVGGTKDGSGFLGGLSDVWLGGADFVADQIINDFRAGSEGFDRLHRLQRGPRGEIYVAFTVSGRDVSFGGLGYDLDAAPVPVSVSTHAFLGLIRSDGTPGWLTPLGLSQAAGGSLTPVDLSVNNGGVAYVTMEGAGTYLIEGISETLSGSGQITVSGKGRVIDHTPTAAVATAKAGAVPDLENRLVFGATGGQSAFSTIESVAVNQTPYFVCYQDPGNPANTIDDLSALVTDAGGQVHLESNFAAAGIIGVAAYLTPDQFRILSNDPVVKVLADPLIVAPDGEGFGEVQDPDWALARLFDPHTVDVSDPSVSYYFPSGFVTDESSASAVRVYVIDKGLAENEPFNFPDLGGGLPIVFDGANGLCVDSLVHPVENGQNVPDTSSNHPRQVVNLFAAADLGSAQGTAMELINVDMYSGASPDDDNCLTYASYVSHAILEALSDASDRNLGNPLPTVIVIASSGPDPMDQVGIGGALAQALAENVPVVISAGNGGGDASDYVPALHGTMDGVITVGGTSLGQGPFMNPTLADLNPLYPSGNTDPSGQVISLYAPGDAVGTGFGSGSGTSFSCALVAGLAATCLSLHPAATAAEVEAALVEVAVYDPGRDLFLARSACTFAAWLYGNGLGELATCPQASYAIDSDFDGDSNFWEFLGGSDPMDSDSRALVPVGLELDGSTGFLSAWLPDTVVGQDGALADGCWTLPFDVQLSDDLDMWQTIDLNVGILTSGEVSGPLQELRFELDLEPYHSDKCFLRFDFGPPDWP